MTYPMEFHCEAATESGMSRLWNVSAVDAKASCCIPKEFDGPGGAFSPEDLFALALTNCFLATFKVYAENSKLGYDGLAAKGHLIVDMDSEQKRPVMKSFRLDAEIKNASNVDKAKLLARKAFASGFILNSVKTSCELDFKIA